MASYLLVRVQVCQWGLPGERNVADVDHPGGHFAGDTLPKMMHGLLGQCGDTPLFASYCCGLCRKEWFSGKSISQASTCCCP